MRLPLLSLAFVLSAASAHADGPSRAVRLEYTRGRGAERCPDEDVLRDVIVARMEADPFAPDGARRLAVAITREARGYGSSARLYDSAGALLWARELAPIRDCGMVVDGIGLTIAIQLDDAPPPPTPPSPPRAGVVPPAGAPPRPDAAAPPREASGPAGALRAEVGAGIAVDFGAGPRAAPGFSAEVGVRWRALSVAVEGRADLATGTGAAGGGELRTSRYAGALVPCGHLGVFFGCGLAELGLLRGTSTGVDQSAPTSVFHAAAGGRLGVELPVAGAFAARISGDLLAATQRSTFRIDGQSAWTVPPVSGAVGLGIVTLF